MFKGGRGRQLGRVRTVGNENFNYDIKYQNNSIRRENYGSMSIFDKMKITDICWLSDLCMFSIEITLIVQINSTTKDVDVLRHHTI